MYSSMGENGHMTPFHFPHYVSRAVGQVGLVMTEATAVQPEGRISAQDLGIWHDDFIQEFIELNEQIHSYGAKSGIQLAHAGRKAKLKSPGSAPSALAFSESFKEPIAMSIEDIRNTVQAFADAASRAKKANFDIVEIHAAHGYLINQFLSPLSNRRSDQYGGTRENRYRFLSEIIRAIRNTWEGPLFIRISTDEYHERGNKFEDILYFTEQMKDEDVDLIDCSSGGVVPASISSYPGYQVNRCEAIKKQTSIATGAVGLITTGIQAEEILQNNRADIVFIGRALLRNPYWAKTAADELRQHLQAPTQYKRGWH
jgi:NADPH2 dehydrogenase